jgi:BirA family biotin operon repressor/biotin-[acetyl-CoA-carboxylase] ligase
MMEIADIRLPESWRLEWVEETDSTNQRLKEHPPEHGYILGAESQTAGRGRRGAAWLSDPGEGLTFSLMLLPLEPRGLWPRLALATGLAVAEALGKIGVEAEVKWPNDVLVAGSKICGILVEAVGPAAIIGIGLNVNSSAFPPKIAATSLYLESGREWEREEILSLLLQEIDARVRQIGQGFDDLLHRLRQRCALTGHLVRLHTPAGELQGRVIGIGPQGELLLNTSTGLQHLLQADEVRIISEE